MSQESLKCVIWGHTLFPDLNLSHGHTKTEWVFQKPEWNDFINSWSEHNHSGKSVLSILKDNLKKQRTAYIYKNDTRNGLPGYIVYNLWAGGYYNISRKLLLTLAKGFNISDDGNITRQLNDEEKIRLSGHIAHENLKNRIPSLDKIIEDQKNSHWLNQLPRIPDDDEKAFILLKGLVTLYPEGGSVISLDLSLDRETYTLIENELTSFLWALSYSKHQENFKYLLCDILDKDNEYIKIDSNYAGGGLDIQITPKGFRKIKNLQNTTPNQESKQAFIAMWIDSSMNDLKTSIQTAIKKAGYEPLRIDDKHHNNKIDDEILSEIKKSLFIICDLTSSHKDKPRPSVYFEAGYAKGLNIPVIWTCDAEMKEVQSNSFDTRQYNCIFWNKNNFKKFEQDLQSHIENDEYIRETTYNIQNKVKTNIK